MASRVTVEIPVIPLCQGRTNGCGTSALAMAINTLKPESPVTQALLDKGNRELDGFSAPAMLVRLARQYGLYAQMKNRMTPQEVAEHLQQGHLLLALVQVPWSTPPGGLHYMLLHGAQLPLDDEASAFLLTDPAYGRTEWFPAHVFLPQWAGIKLKGFPTGFHQFAIVLSATNNLEHHRHIPLSNMVASAMSHLLVWFGRFWKRFHPY